MGLIKDCDVIPTLFSAPAIKPTRGIDLGVPHLGATTLRTVLSKSGRKRAPGSNYIARTSSALFNTPHLEWTDPTGRALGQRYTNVNVSGLASGPIAYDKAFYNIAYQAGRRASDLHTLLNTNPSGLQTEGIAFDSLAALLDVLEGARVPRTVDGFPADRLTDQGLILGALDFTPSTSTSGQAFNVTFIGNWNRTSPASPPHDNTPGSELQLDGMERSTPGAPQRLLRRWRAQRNGTRWQCVTPLRHAASRSP